MNEGNDSKVPRRRFLGIAAGAGFGGTLGVSGDSKSNDSLAPQVEPWKEAELVGEVGVVGEYFFAASTADQREVSLQIDWGGGDLSDWSKPVRSGQLIRTSHVYLRGGSFQVRARAKNAVGGESDWKEVGVVQVPLPPGVPSDLIGLWEFHDPDHPAAARYGWDLEWVGEAPEFSPNYADQGEEPQVMTGVVLTRAGKGNHWVAKHHSGDNGGGKKTNEYTLAMDVLIPMEEAWHALIQSDLDNQRDATFFIRGHGGLPASVGRGKIGYSSAALLRERWQRIIITVDLAKRGSVSYYLNGQLSGSFRPPEMDSEFALDPARVSFFADEDGENSPLHVAMCAIFSRALTSEEVASIGTPGMSIIRPVKNEKPFIELAEAPSLRSKTGQPTLVSYRVNDPDGHETQIEVNWGDGITSGWTVLADSSKVRKISHRWHMPGEFTIAARARDAHGGTSEWQDLHTLQVDGDPQLTILTQPWLQNMATDRMVVMLETAEPADLILQYGPDFSALESSVPCESVATGGGGFFHRALVMDLPADREIHFRFASRCGRPTRAKGSFRTAPADDREFSFAAIGDVQTDNRIRKLNRWAWSQDPWSPAKEILHDIVGKGFDFALGLGDHANDGNSYQSTRLSHLDRMCAILGDRLPFYLVWGNHDGNSPQHPLRLAADLPSRFRQDTLSTHTPGFGSYAFRHAGVFFVCLEHFRTHGLSHQEPSNDITNGWIDQALSSEAARTAAFRVIGVHVPPFCERWIDGEARLRENLVPRLEKYRVDLCLSGHMHGYQRGELNGTHYVISGCGSYLDFGEPLVAEWPHFTQGGHRNVPGNYAMESSPGVLGEPQPIEGGLFHGYTEVIVRKDRMVLRQHGYHANGSPIGVLDEFEILRRA